MRARIELISSEHERLAALRDAAALLLAAPAGAFPPLEARWLVTMAWNRGATHDKFDRAADAFAFMDVAVQMVGALPDGTLGPGDKVR